MCCAISGTLGYESTKVEKMILHQHQRGPDGCNWLYADKEKNLIFGHNRLAIIDLSDAGKQPMQTDRYTLTYNGEIYNYKEMRGRLYANDDMGNAPGGNDAKTLLLYIQKFGLAKAVADSNGMFAFALYDNLTKDLHLVVDRFGQKPLYYYHDGDKFAFSSSPGALVGLKESWQIDRYALQSYWLLGCTMGANSLWNGIKKVCAAEWVTFNLQTGRIYNAIYWKPQYKECHSGIEDLVLDAINKVKVADVPVHVFLSGGIDSTLVASQCGGMGAIHLDSPELRYAQQAADKFGVDLKTVCPTVIDVEESLIDYAFQAGEPSMASLIPYITSQESAKFCKVAISANGADELFFGYDRTQEKISQKQIDHTYRSINCLDKWFFQFNTYFNGENNGRMWELGGYVQFDLNRTLDAASMCHSLEVRSPFLDHRLVEMALSIPEGKHIDMRLGRKAILKRMLQGMGFENGFLTRPKLGFSLHKEPANMESLKTKAWKWVKEEGFLQCDDSKLSPRDERYLKASALSFYYWFRTWEHRIS